MTKNVPEWVMAYRTKGTMIRFINDEYYLYTNRSHREPGKKYPVPEQKYIGRISREGLIERFDINTTQSGIGVREYGFSKAVMELAPEKFIRELKDEERARKVLRCIICRISPCSYLSEGCTEVCDEEVKANISLQRKKLEEMLGLDLEELHGRLGTIYQLDIGGRKITSRISDEQKTLLEGLGVTL